MRFSRAVGATIMDVVYGIQVTGIADEYITMAEKSLEMISAAMLPGAYLVDLLPLREYSICLPYNGY